MNDDNPAVEQVTGEDAEHGKVEQHLKSRSTWLRLVFMCIFAILISLAGMVGSFVVLLGFLWVLFTGEVNRQLQQVGQSLASYMAEIVLYLTYNSEEKPFPLGGAWPSPPAETAEE